MQKMSNGCTMPTVLERNARPSKETGKALTMKYPATPNAMVIGSAQFLQNRMHCWRMWFMR